MFLSLYIPTDKIGDTNETLLFAARLLMAMAFGLTSFTPVMASETGVTLANPAAVCCVENGGHYGIRQTENGTVGICMKEDGTARDAW
ncbi:DUF333 domain-containing protein [Falsihalocynthiibacter sp. SS001]|uniref:DUF333 domain-containing protein n=1 Tax=Falsihalocynthiibacter sp. SS001 TaxID=3349698 RepID=UPI0036D3F3A1